MGLHIFQIPWIGASSVKALPRKWAAETLYGDYWNNTTEAWTASQPSASAMVPLTEGTGIYAGLFSGTVTANMDNYSGIVTVTLHNGDTGVALSVSEQRIPLRFGEELFESPGLSPTQVIDDLTWVAPAEGSRCLSLVTINSGFDGTLSVDFTNKLEGNRTALYSTPSVTASGLSPANVQIANDYRHINFDISGATSGTDYNVLASAITTDGQLVQCQGVLRVE